MKRKNAEIERETEIVHKSVTQLFAIICLCVPGLLFGRPCDEAFNAMVQITWIAGYHYMDGYSELPSKHNRTTGSALHQENLPYPTLTTL